MKLQKQTQSSNSYQRNLKFCPEKFSPDYWFIQGKIGLNASISINRYEHIASLNTICQYPKLKISIRDINEGYWTKWKNLENSNESLIYQAYELHRNLLLNEIVIESDYETYNKNLEASKFIGGILESKGYHPLYYYGGNKSLHIHIFIDLDYILKINQNNEEKLRKYFNKPEQFLETFIVWLRKELITKYPLGLYEFDTNLIKQTHLIRSELSMNKQGFKTFLGYEAKSLPAEPYICNTVTTNYPEIATSANPIGEVQHELKLSKPINVDDLMSKFIEDYELEKSKQINAAIMYRSRPTINKIRSSVAFILSNNFAESPDGYKRAMFILINELRRFNSPAETNAKIIDWNKRMGNKINESEIEFRTKAKTNYKLTNTYIAIFLQELGFKKHEFLSYNQ